MTVGHLPAADVTPARASGHQVLAGNGVITDEPAPMAGPVADAAPGSNDAKQQNGHCSGYNVWA